MSHAQSLSCQLLSSAHAIAATVTCLTYSLYRLQLDAAPSQWLNVAAWKNLLPCACPALIRPSWQWCCRPIACGPVPWPAPLPLVYTCASDACRPRMTPRTKHTTPHLPAHHPADDHLPRGAKPIALRSCSTTKKVTTVCGPSRA
jgi:hypothetical protein